MTSYRVREKALSLLLQIAGRSGRSGEGDVLIQTKNDQFFNHYLSYSDYEDFLKDELKSREELYPPFIRMARVIFQNKNAFIAKQDLDKYVNIANQYKEINIVGFGESGIFKLSNRYRYELLLKTTNIKVMLSFLHSIKSLNVIVDMDSLG